jgi:hypothetical protein
MHIKHTYVILVAMVIAAAAYGQSFAEAERRCHEKHWYNFVRQQILKTSTRKVAREIKSGRLRLSGKWLTIVWRHRNELEDRSK